MRFRFVINDYRIAGGGVSVDCECGFAIDDAVQGEEAGGVDGGGEDVGRGVSVCHECYQQ